AFIATSDKPAQAGFLSFFHHKKKHHPEFVDETSEDSGPANNANPVNSPPRLSQPQTVPKSASPVFYPKRMVGTENNNFAKNRTSDQYLAPAQPKPIKRDWLPPQPTNCACLGNQKHIIRIGVALNLASFELIAPDGARLFDASSGEMVATLPPQNRWAIASGAQSLVFRPKQPSLAAARWIAENSGQEQARLKPV